MTGKRLRMNKVSFCINGRFLGRRITGVQRYGREVVRELDLRLSTLDGVINAEILVPQIPKDLPSYRAIRVRRVGFLTGHAWEQLELPFYCHGRPLFTPSSAAPLLYPKNLPTIHDTAIFSAPSGYSARYGNWYKILGWILCRTSLKVLTVSEFSKAELLRWCCKRPESIVVTYSGWDHAVAAEPDPRVLEKWGLLPGRYILSVGSKNPNKNFRGVALALPYLRGCGLDIVIAGHHDDPVFRRTAADFPGIKSIGYVTDPELRSLYENAACFVFPSLYEGFGLPPLEALALGCNRVVVSDRASLPEIYAGMASFCDPGSPQDIAEKVLAAIGAPRRTQEESRELQAQIRRYSWKACADKVWEALHEFLDE